MADYLASLGWTPVVLCSTAWLRLTGVNSHVKCHFHSNTYFRLDRTDAQFVDIIHTAGYWVYFDQCIIFFMIFLLSIQGWNIHSQWSCGHLAQWRQGASTWMRKKVKYF